MIGSGNMSKRKYFQICSYTWWLNIMITVIMMTILNGENALAEQAIVLGENKMQHVMRNGILTDKFTIFCYLGQAKSYDNLWKSVQFRAVDISVDEYELYPGNDEAEVEKAHASATQSWFHLMAWPTQTIRLDVFNRSCVGVHSRNKYIARLEIKRIDYWKISQLILGALMFFLAPTLSRNIYLHYASGVGFGLTASILILIFIVSRMVPKRSGAITFLFGGWAIVLYLVQLLWTNLQVIFRVYYNYVVVYAIVVSIVSFAVCYRYGPVKDPRTLDLIQWGVQLLALVMILLSSENREFSMALVLVALAIYTFPRRWSSAMKTYWRRKFPPKVRLLTEEEYRDQMNLTTQQQLKQLRDFCRSPKCDTWHVVKQLKTPLRFASFVEGESHLLDDEILYYETSENFTTLDSSDNEDLES